MEDDIQGHVGDEERLAAVEHELKQICGEIQKLSERKNELVALRDKLKDRMNLEKSKSLADQNWDRTDFPWYEKFVKTLQDVFKIQEFRPHQLATMNATMSGQDAILIMPTGGGKSLTYQLTAVVDKGFTLVVSPLLSLMEDQVIALRSLNIDAGMFHSQSDKAETNRLMQAMTDPKSQLKLIYATPEKLAKSKRFMSKLQKAYESGRLARIAIDEVHCCSQWGHDFRPDYKFLGVLKPMFPDVPILGLTATATSKVTVDVQKMLDIQGCIVFKASFNRPNLYYELRPKPSVMTECVDQLADLLKHRFANQSGIIYTTSIKDCEELREQLRKRDLRVSGYHANLDAALRSSVHRKWLTGEYQAVVATIAFGLGIDKPDVRFVIHHALSKSMENFYQESGRAGRDGKPAECILFYRLADVFRLSTMVFTQQTGLQCLYGMVEYCLDAHRCRRQMIASHFDEVWDRADCNKMCDHCRASREPKKVDVTKHCRTVYKLLAQAAASDTKMTAQKILDAWYGKGPPALKLSGVSPPTFSRDTAENILAHLLVNGYLKEDFHFTPYSTISYVRRGGSTTHFPLNFNNLKNLNRLLENYLKKWQLPLELHPPHQVIEKGQLASKVDDPSYVISMTIRGKSADDEKPSGKPADAKSSSSKSPKPAENAKRKRTGPERGEKHRKVYVIESDSE